MMDILDKQIKLPFTNRSISIRYALVHTAYWVLITGFFIYEKRYLIYKASMPFFVVCVSARILLLIMIAYLNISYFLPRFLMKKRYRAYFVAVILAVLAYLLMQSLVDYFLYGYIIGPTNRSDLWAALYYNFFSTLWYLGLMLALKLSIDWYGQQSLIQKIKVEKLNAEIDFLRAQVNPHFLFNILNNLYALTLKKSDLAPDVVLKLSEMMEYMLYDSTGEKVSLEKEVAYLDNYMELERLRFSDGATINLNKSSDLHGYEIAPLLLLPLVENAFKHGLGRQPENGKLAVDVAVDSQKLTVVVENTKPSLVSQKGKGGIGLVNLQQRLALLYPAKHQLVLEDKGDTYRAQLVIEL